MLTIEIAGHTLVYKNAPDLNEKARTLMEEIRDKRRSMEKHSLALRGQERLLLRFLGLGKMARSESPKDGLSLTARSKEEIHNA
jgi:hypothetical protein